MVRYQVDVISCPGSAPEQVLVEAPCELEAARIACEQGGTPIAVRPLSAGLLALLHRPLFDEPRPDPGMQAEFFERLREALAKLDVLPRQVMIEAILAEVVLNDNLRYGVQWFFGSDNKSYTFSALESGNVEPQFPGFSFVNSRLPDARVVLNALQSKTDVKVLSAPRLTVLNNQKASLQVGDEVPIRTQVSQGTGAPGAPVISSIQMRDTGVILEVAARVNDSGNVILDVSQEISEVASTNTSGIDSPTIQKRRMRSVVATRDGATVAMAGLIRESQSYGNSGLPLLKDLPLMGNLFRTNTAESRRTELLVLLVPHVIRDHDEADAVADLVIGSLNAASGLASHAANLVPRPIP